MYTLRAAPITLSDSFVEQFAEDWLLFGIVANLPTGEVNQLNITFYFDFSTVKFTVPMLNILCIGENKFVDITAKYYLPVPPRKQNKVDTNDLIKRFGYSLNTEDKEVQTFMK